MRVVRFSLVVLCASDNRGFGRARIIDQGHTGCSTYKEPPIESMDQRMILPEPRILFVFEGADTLVFF